MSTCYIEIKNTPGGVHIGVYTPEQYAAKRQRARARRAAQRRREAVKETAGALAAGIGFLMMLGAAGAADLGTITPGGFVGRSVLGLALMVGGLYAAKAFYGQEARAQWNKKK